MTFCGYFSSAPVAALAELVVPSADDGTTGWSSSSALAIWNELGQIATTNYAQSVASTSICPTVTNRVFTVLMADPSAVPGDASVQGMRLVFNIRHREATIVPTGEQAEWTVRLLEGAAEIASRSLSGSAYDTWQPESQNLLPAEVALITDHNDLKIEVSVDLCVATGDIEAQIAYVEIEYYALP